MGIENHKTKFGILNYGSYIEYTCKSLENIFMD